MSEFNTVRQLEKQTNLCYIELMTPEIQTAIALSLVAGTVLYFVRGWLAKRKKPGCGGGCGCSGKKF